MSTPTGQGGTFHPRTLPSRGRRILLWIFGPIIWAGSLLVAAIVETETNTLLIAGAIAGGTLVVAFVVLLPGAIKRHRRMAGR